MAHSKIVGGSTAKRVIACPGSVSLCAKMPPSEGNEYTRRGTMLHQVIAEYLDAEDPDKSVQHWLGTVVEGQELTDELLESKIIPALTLLNEVDPDQVMEYAIEVPVDFGDFLPGVFGTMDLIGKRGRTGIMLDWKFGDGVAVSAEENEQLMFGVAAAMRTPAAKWAFEDVDEIECIIIQPPEIKRWTTTKDRIAKFEQELKRAVSAAAKPNAPHNPGTHCRFCAGKPLCPQMTGAAQRAVKIKLDTLPVKDIAGLLQEADIVEGWIADLRALAFKMLDEGVAVPGYKLVAKRGVRQWVNEGTTAAWCEAQGLKKDEYIETSLLSPAKLEKALKARKLTLPADLAVSISSGSTMAEESDPRPALLQIGKQLSAAIAKLS